MSKDFFETVVRTLAHGKVLLSFLLVAGCASTADSVQFDVPKHSLGVIIAAAASVRSKGDVADVKRNLIHFQESHVKYLPDRVSRLIKACDYISSHNISGISLPDVLLGAPDGDVSNREVSRGDLEINKSDNKREKNGRLASLSVSAPSKSGQTVSNRAPSPADKQVSQEILPNAPQSSMEVLGRFFASKAAEYGRKENMGSLKVAVHPFAIRQESSGGQEVSSSHVLESEVERSLIGKDGLQLITRRSLKDLQAEKRLIERDLAGDSAKKYVVREADLIVRGSAVMQSGGSQSLYLDCEMLDPASGIIVASKRLKVATTGGEVSYFVR